MSEHAIQLARLEDLEVMAGISVKEANKACVNVLLVSIRESVMRTVDAMRIPHPPALFFDHR
jgi:hypothetical protein